MVTRRAHWDEVWATCDPTNVSWYQATPERSIALVASTGTGPTDPVVDIGGGVSRLVIGLAQHGFRDLTVVDIAAAALHLLDVELEAAVGDHQVALVCSDILDWRPTRPYALWHDRAVNHFLVEPEHRHAYASILTDAVQSGGHVILAAFSPDGPDRCSGLPVHRSQPGQLAHEFAPAFDLRSVTIEQHRTPWNTTQSFQYLLLHRR